MWFVNLEFDTMKTYTVTSAKELIERVKNDTQNWTHDGFARPWYRGVGNKEYLLLPSILRNGNSQVEFRITTKFRLMAPNFGKTPETNRLDQWLFFMQHNRCPTRLLDWSESPLVAAFFATENIARKNNFEYDRAVYALDPIRFNKMSNIDHFPNTWTQQSTLQTIKFAFGTQDELVNGQCIPYLEKPVAIYPSTIHARISSQKGCFTLHGNDKRDIVSIFEKSSLIEEGFFIKYIIPKEHVVSIFNDINNLGIRYSTLFPDIEGLSQELCYEFGI